MAHQLVYCTVRESKRRVIYVVRVQDEILEPFELENIADLMASRTLGRRRASETRRHREGKKWKSVSPAARP